MKIKVVDKKGKEVKSIDLLKDIFEVDVNSKILSQYTYIYLSNQRQSNAHTKDRSEVRGGGKKPHKQKGTGRARSGSNRNPLWTGGGTIFGPTNKRNFKKKLTKKFKKVALKHALSQSLINNNIVIVSNFDVKEGEQLTKQAIDILSNLKGDSRKVTVVVAEHNTILINAFANIENAYVKTVKDMNVYDIITGGKIVFELDALKYIEETLVK